MIALTLGESLRRQQDAGGPWAELLRVPDLSVGLYVLPAGGGDGPQPPPGVDGQQPHTEDEVYVVLAGRSRFTAGGESRDAGPGDVIFVPARVPHRFHDISEELRVVVVFG